MKIPTLRAVIALSTLVAVTSNGQVAVPHEFEAGTPARAAEVNENFAVLVDAVNAQEEAIAGIEGGIEGPEGPAGPPGPPGPAGEPGSAAVVLDLSAPLIIDQPGIYVLDQDWLVGGGDWSIEIVADDVTLDLQGFEIDGGGNFGVLRVTGDGVTVRGGRIRVDPGVALETVGLDALIYGMNIHSSDGQALSLGGSGSAVRNSTITANEGSAIRAMSGTTVQGNYISGKLLSLSLTGSDVMIVDNRFGCGISVCAQIRSDESVFSRNAIMSILANAENAIWVVGNGNHIVDNLFTATGELGPAITIEGAANFVRGNIIPAPGAGSIDPVWPYGIRFTADGNFYGGNIVSASVPFDTNSTVQTDLGGNVGL